VKSALPVWCLVCALAVVAPLSRAYCAKAGRILPGANARNLPTGLLRNDNYSDQVVCRYRMADHPCSQAIFESGEKIESFLGTTIWLERFR
jgi:hypothetical protein